MTSETALFLLARSSYLAKIFTLNALRKREDGLLAGRYGWTVKVPVLSLINALKVDVVIDNEGSSWDQVRSALEANRVVFGLDAEYPTHLIGYVDESPWLEIFHGHQRTLHLRTFL